MRRLVLLPNSEQSILEKIISEDGNCSWSNARICSMCPMNRLKTKDNGEFASCVEAIGIDGLTEQEADSKYKKQAEELLIDMSIDEVISGGD